MTEETRENKNMQRLGVLSRHLAGDFTRKWNARPSGHDAMFTAAPTAGFSTNRPRSKQVAPKPSDIVVLTALRTPIGKSRKGSFKDTHVDDLLATVLKAVIDQSNIKPEEIGDIIVGNVLGPGAGAFHNRIAQFYAGIPHTVPAATINRQCSSGLQAFITAAGHIKLGAYDMAIAGGMETMSRMNNDALAQDVNPRIFQQQETQDCLIPMGTTSENISKMYNVTREEQDQFSLESQQKAAHAQKSGWFDDEIVPVTTTFIDKDGGEKTITVTKDDGIRPTTLAGLAKLKPAFAPDGCSTAGNSSQTSDGAAAVLLANRAKADSLGLPILGQLVSFAVVGVPPHIMGVGPAYAIPKALEKADLTVDDIDIFEINEAFASQALWCVKELGIPKEKVNPKGGAIAFGHPLGCTGSRMIGTLLHELKRREKPGYGVVSMCIGTGMGAAAVFYHPGKK